MYKWMRDRGLWSRYGKLTGHIYLSFWGHGGEMLRQVLGPLPPGEKSAGLLYKGTDDGLRQKGRGPRLDLLLRGLLGLVWVPDQG